MPITFSGFIEFLRRFSAFFLRLCAKMTHSKVSSSVSPSTYQHLYFHSIGTDLTAAHFQCAPIFVFFGRAALLRGYIPPLMGRSKLNMDTRESAQQVEGRCAGARALALALPAIRLGNGLGEFAVPLSSRDFPKQSNQIN